MMIIIRITHKRAEKDFPVIFSSLLYIGRVKYAKTNAEIIATINGRMMKYDKSNKIKIIPQKTYFLN